jgi:predicted GNAT family acetyltransferase
MSIDLTQHSVQNNTERRRFEVKIDGKISVAEYIKTSQKLFLTHTEVPKGMEGNGIASHLAKAAFQFARDNELRIMPLCPYMAAYMKRHPEWQDLLADGVNI